MKKINNYFLLAFSCLFLILTACKGDSGGGSLAPVTDPPPVTQPQTPPPGTVDETGGFYIKVNPPAGTTYYIHNTTDFTKDCVVAKTATAMADIDINCTVEVQELEGAFHGINLVLNTPSDMCQYVMYYPSFYYGRNFGDGPALITMNYDKDGTFLGGTADANGSVTADQTLRCDFDYSGEVPSGPNCCSGTYTKVTNHNVGSVDPTKLPFTVIDAGLKWTGKPGNCASGAGLKTVDLDPDSGMPKLTFYNSPDGLNTQFVLGEPLTLNLGSFYYANYYTGAAPAAFKLASTPSGNRYYDYYCMDQANEQHAHIAVQVREWNEVSQFLLKDLGDPETTGVDPIFGYPVNNWADWADVVAFPASYPGGFPGMPHN